ncbi:reverse transcriptase domain-containing protein [Tanacetum coccineum]
MRTRSQSRRRRQQQVTPTFVEPFDLEKPNNNQEPPNPPVVTMADNRTMAEMLQAPTEGYEDAIVVPAITADNFELKHSLLTLVQNKQFFGHDKEDPHAHIRYFNKITSTMKFPNVPSTSVKLMLFPFSLEGAARIWLEKEPPRSILTWDDLVSKFINQFFPPSKMTNLRNEITRFQQRFDESFYEAWDRFNDLLRACPHHGFSELHQLDTFYNALNSNDQDSLNSAAGGNFLDKMPRECLKIIEGKSKVRLSRSKAIVAKVSTSSSTSTVSSDVAELKDMVRALLLDKKNQSKLPLPFPPVQNQGNNQNRYNQNQGNNYNQSPIFQPPVNQPSAYQAPSYQASAPQAHGVSKANFESYVKANDAVMQNMQSQMTNIMDLLTKFVNSNTTSTSGSGSLPSNTIANPKGDVKAITTRSGVSCNGPQIPPSISSLPKEMENEPEVTKDTVQPSTKNIQPPMVQTNDQIGKVMTTEVFIDYIADPRVPLILGRPFLRTTRAMIDVHGEKMTLRHDDQSITFKVGDTKTFSYNTIESVNRVDVIDIACEEYVQEVLKISESGNHTSPSDLMIDSLSPSFTPFGGSDFLMEEIDAFLEHDDSIPPGVDDNYDSEEILCLALGIVNV